MKKIGNYRYKSNILKSIIAILVKIISKIMLFFQKNISSLSVYLYNPF